MPATPRSSLLLVGCLLFVGIVTFSWPLSPPVFLLKQTAMENLNTPFTIQVNGESVAPVATDADDGAPAQLGPEAATFTLKDGRLVSGDWILGRDLTEDRSLRPKKLSWFKDGTEPARKLHMVTAHQTGDIHRLKFGGGCLIAEDDGIYVDLFGGQETCSTIQYI